MVLPLSRGTQYPVRPRGLLGYAPRYSSRGFVYDIDIYINIILSLDVVNKQGVVWIKTPSVNSSHFFPFTNPSPFRHLNFYSIYQASENQRLIKISKCRQQRNNSHKLISVYFRRHRALLCGGCGDSLFVSGRCAGADTDGDWLLNTHTAASVLSLQYSSQQLITRPYFMSK